MKKREILCLLAGCMLLVSPMQARANELSELLSQVTIGPMVTENDNTAEIETEDIDSSDVETEDGDVVDSDTEDDVIFDSDAEAIQDILGTPVGSGAILEVTKTEKEYAEAYEKAKNANWGYTNLGIANVDNNLNVRAVAAEDGKIIGKLPKNAACEVLDSDGTWAHIMSGNVDGYVS